MTFESIRSPLLQLPQYSDDKFLKHSLVTSRIEEAFKKTQPYHCQEQRFEMQKLQKQRLVINDPAEDPRKTYIHQEIRTLRTHTNDTAACAGVVGAVASGTGSLVVWIVMAGVLFPPGTSGLVVVVCTILFLIATILASTTVGYLFYKLLDNIFKKEHDIQELTDQLSDFAADLDFRSLPSVTRAAIQQHLLSLKELSALLSLYKQFKLAQQDCANRESAANDARAAVENAHTQQDLLQTQIQSIQSGLHDQIPYLIE